MRVVSDQPRLVSPSPPEKKLARQHRTAFQTAAVSVGVVAIICFIAFAASTQHSNNTLTDQEYAFARDLVRQEIRQDGAVLTSATVTAGYGQVTDSNIGHPCLSGRLLHIRLIGDFLHVVTTGHPVQPGAPIPDFAVRAVDLTADAKTGRLCLVRVQTGNVAPAPGAISLPVN